MDSPLIVFFSIIALLVILDILALRFGVDSRRYDPRRDI